VVKSSTIDFAATRAGAAFQGVRSAWTYLSGVGTSYVCTLNAVLAAWTDAHAAAALPPVPATPTQLVMAALAGKQRTLNETRKQNVHKTHIGAGGSGALGSHPEREPAY
jgi:hypothetical protein